MSLYIVNINLFYYAVRYRFRGRRYKFNKNSKINKRLINDLI